MFNSINNFFRSKKNTKLIDEISNKYLEKINNFEKEVNKLSKEEINSKIQKLRGIYITKKNMSYPKSTYVL